MVRNCIILGLAAVVVGEPAAAAAAEALATEGTPLPLAAAGAACEFDEALCEADVLEQGSKMSLLQGDMFLGRAQFLAPSVSDLDRSSRDGGLLGPKGRLSLLGVGAWASLPAASVVLSGIDSTLGRRRNRGAVGAAVAFLILALLLLLFIFLLLCAWTGQPETAESRKEQLEQSAPGDPALEAGSRAQDESRMSLLSLSNSVSSVSKSDLRLPAICPALILEHTEARFMIAMDCLTIDTVGTIDILGPCGRTLLHASVSTADGRRCLSVASVGYEDDPRAMVISRARTPGDELGAAEGLEAQDQRQQDSFQIYGRGGEHFAVLEPSTSDGLLLFLEDKPVLSVEVGSAADLRMSAYAQDGRPLAVAGRNISIGGRPKDDGVDTWKLQVKPAVDAILVIACMLTKILLRPWPVEPTRGAPQSHASSLAVNMTRTFSASPAQSLVFSPSPSVQQL